VLMTKPLRKAALFALVLASFTVSALAQPVNTPPPAVQLVINGHRFPADSYALLVHEIGAAEPLLAVNADATLNPASTMKLVTTLAALETLGPTYSWRTEVFALGEVANGTLHGDLLIRGGGDPFLVEEHLRSLLKTVQRRGIRAISGNLILDSSRFDASVSLGPSMDNQSNRAYNVLPHALLSNFQAVNFYFYPHANGRDIVIQADPPLPNLRIENRLTQATGACTGFQRGISFSENRSTQTVTFSGRFPARCGEYSLTRTVLDHEQYLAGLFTYLWRELGGEFNGRLGDAPSSPDAEGSPVAVWQSPPLLEIIQSINKYSNNVMTRHLLLTLGMEKNGSPATVSKGITAMHDWLDEIGIPRDSLAIENGAGLSREARLSANFLRDILLHGSRIPNMPEFIASLPLSGLDGTMRDRLSNERGTGRAHAKTGSLNGVAAIAGYVHAHSGRRFVVVAIVNHEGADTGTGQELGDALLNWALTQ
jgi:serine-type D-Ala-D-Ala carboxypeptidase/endopeptidase (penicillin-binding protein 4)